MNDTIKDQIAISIVQDLLQSIPADATFVDTKDMDFLARRAVGLADASLELFEIARSVLDKPEQHISEMLIAVKNDIANR